MSSTPANISIPHLADTLPLLSPDTSDIEGALKDMSPLKIQDLDEEEDLEILFSRLKGNTGNISQIPNIEEQSSSEEDPNSFHAVAEGIRKALSTSNPNVNKALSLLDTLQANYLAAEITEVSSLQVKQNSHSSAKTTKDTPKLAHPDPFPENQVPPGFHHQPLLSSSFPQCITTTETPPDPTILLYPTSSSSSNLSELLNEALPPKDFIPTNIKPIRGNGFAISFQSQSHIKNFQSKLEENSNLKSSIRTKLPTKRSPSLILYNIPISTKEVEIQEALKTQLHLTSRLNLRFKFKGNSTVTTNWVFEAPAPTLNTIHQVKKIQIGWSMFRISEFIHFKKCNFCQAFGHTTKDCHRQVSFCSKCAGHHLTSDCQSPSFCCISCLESNIFSGTEYPTFHSAKDRSCPFFQAAIDQYRVSINY
ncbi:hypothetical protein AVEN_36622-1 [Araneus ventricosus]|uniref:Pre-C2HC domain-containing protein n=1 Tax=Araneus ventricosus TaxID=182803 RepID=A0A4Y2SVB2_ARAVE|nr:hypothetical protein AVEN_36622-1 [Araneus ventricosus]